MTRNSENPFVKNEYYFLYSLPYDQTTLYWIHKISHDSAFLVGLLLVSLLLFLIAFKTPPSFRPYSKMLLLCVFTDLIILTGNFLVQGRLQLSNGIVLVSLTSPIYQLSYKAQCNLIVVQVLAATIAPAVLPLQYLYRYRTIKERRPPTILQTLLSYCVSLLAVSVILILTFQVYNDDPGGLPDIDYSQFWFEERPIPILIVTSVNSKWMLIELMYLSMYLIVCYGLTVWLARQTMKELDSRVFELTQRTKSLQNQFSTTLLVQALTPLVTSVLPLLFIVIEILRGSSAGYNGEFVAIGVTWFPILNCLSNITFIVPYRRYCLRLVPGYNKTFSVVQPSIIVTTVEQNLHSVNIRT